MSIIYRDQACIGHSNFAPRKKVLGSQIWPVLLLLLASVSGGMAALPGQTTLLTPTEGAAIDKLDLPTFSWSQGQPQADWFYIYLNRNGSHYLDLWRQANDFSATNSWVPNVLPAGNYTWWVRGWTSAGFGAWSPAGNFTILGMPNKIIPICPQGTEETNSSLLYAWKIADTYTTWYEMLIMKGGSVFSDSWHHLAPGDLTYTPNSQLGQLSLTLKNQPSGIYQWWVRGWSADGLGPWSQTATFTNELMAAGTLTLMSPTRGEVVSNALPEFTWQNNGGGTWCWFLLYRNGGLYNSQWLEATNTWLPSQALPFGNYTWWIVAWNPDGFGVWSNSSFTVPLRRPGNITPLSPSGLIYDKSPIDYIWSADANAAWYELLIYKNGHPFLDRWFPVSASTSPDPGEFDVAVSEPHGTGTYSWWVRGWSSDGMGVWSTNMTFTIFDQNTVLPFEGSTWHGNFTALVNVGTDLLIKTHQITNLTFNADGTNYSGSGFYLLRTNNLNNGITYHVNYAGTYAHDAGTETVTATGTETITGLTQGNTSFTFYLDSTHQHITDGSTWTDVWDSNQEYFISLDWIMRDATGP